MDIIEVVAQVRELLRQQGRLSYRIVCRQFCLLYTSPSPRDS